MIKKSKYKKINLSECSDEEMTSYITQEISGDGYEISPDKESTALVVSSKGSQDLLKKRMSQYIALLRGMQLWYHGAHHVTRGVGFVGDHVTIYGDFYEKIQDEFDGAVEKAIGLTNDEEMACPSCVTSMAIKFLQNYPSPAKCTSLAIASAALQMEKDYLSAVDSMFYELEDSGCMTLGLDDFLMSSYNSHEGNLYKLQQRIKTDLED